MSQFNQEGGADLRELVLANAAINRDHSARDLESQKYIASYPILHTPVHSAINSTQRCKDAERSWSNYFRLRREVSNPKLANAPSSSVLCSGTAMMATSSIAQ